MAIIQTNKDSLIHKGVISKIEGKTLFVTLNGELHCESCHAKGFCGVPDAGPKEVQITNPTDSYTLNETVEIELSKKTGLIAVFWAYFFPFILMLSTLLIGLAFFKEWIAGLLSLGILIPYYAVLALLKDFLQKTFKISILKYS